MPTLDEIDHVDGLDTGAIFSPCRRWRYLLWRRWDEEAPVCAFIGLNPSTADETTNDQTISKCIRYAKAWGYGSLWMLNLFAYRATDPKVMKAVGANAIGPRNPEYLMHAGRRARMVIAAWGCHGTHLDVADSTRKLMASRGISLHYLRLTKDGHPGHPLYLPGKLTPEPWPVLSVAAA